MEKHEGTATRMLSTYDLFKDSQVLANGMIVSVEDHELGTVQMQGVTPNFSRTPGKVNNAGPSIGEHNEEIYAHRLGLSRDEISDLETKKII